MGRELESTTLPEDTLASSIVAEFADDDIDVAFVGEDETELVLDKSDKPALARKGQNEDDPDNADGEPESEEDDGSDPDLSDIKDRAARERVMAARSQAQAQARQFLANEEALHKQVLSAEKRNAAIQRDSAKMALDGIDLRIRTATEALKAAKMDDDKGAEVDLDAQLRELHRVRGEIQTMQAQIPADELLDRKFAQFRAARAKEVQATLGRSGGSGYEPQSSLAGQWKSANTWMGSPKYKIESDAVITLSNQLAEEGYDINSQAHFVELSKRMAKKFPTLGIKDNHGRALGGAPQKSASSSPPVASARTTQVSTSRVNGKVKNQVQLDGNDRRMMRVLGMDPADQKAAKRFAKEKLTRLRAEQRA